MKRPEESYSQEDVSVYSFDRCHLFACLWLDSRFLENSEASTRTHKVDIDIHENAYDWIVFQDVRR